MKKYVYAFLIWPVAGVLFAVIRGIADKGEGASAPFFRLI